MTDLLNFTKDFVFSKPEFFASMALGGLITWLAARYYYIKAGRELLKESEELKRLNILILRGLESGGIADFSSDKNGNIVGMVFKFGGGEQASPAIGGGQFNVTPKNE